MTSPPPRSERIAADEFPCVSAVTSVAFMVPPPVVIRPPEQFPAVRMMECETFTVVPSPYENTPFACVPSVVAMRSLKSSVAPSVAKTAAFSP